MERLTASEWTSLIHGVFAPDPALDRGLAFLVDVPDDRAPDNPDWLARRKMVVDWASALQAAEASHGWDVVVVAVANAGQNNADLPENGFLWVGTDPPNHVRELEKLESISIQEAFGRWSMWIAPTEFSATAPLKLASRDRGDFRAATMPRFSAAMIPALRLPYDEIHRRVTKLKTHLDPAEGAEIDFVLDDGTTDHLYLDLRFRSAHASGGVLRENGQAGNLPSGETFIVPYEGEREDHPSRSEGVMPVELDGEIVRYGIRENRAVEVLTRGPVSEVEADRLLGEPAYGNLAELGLGVLDAYGVQPAGEILLDEKLGLHIAFGRSDHFGGATGAADFSSPEAVVHIDRVYTPSMQPRIPRVSCTLVMPNGARVPLIRDSVWVIDLGS